MQTMMMASFGFRSRGGGKLTGSNHGKHFPREQPGDMITTAHSTRHTENYQSDHTQAQRNTAVFQLFDTVIHCRDVHEAL